MISSNIYSMMRCNGSCFFLCRSDCLSCALFMKHNENHCLKSERDKEQALMCWFQFVEKSTKVLKNSPAKKLPENAVTKFANIAKLTNQRDSRRKERKRLIDVMHLRIAKAIYSMHCPSSHKAD